MLGVREGIVVSMILGTPASIVPWIAGDKYRKHLLLYDEGTSEYSSFDCR